MNTQIKKWVHILAVILVVLGAIDLGLFGLMPADTKGQGFDLLQKVFSFSPTLLEGIYVLIGFSGIYLLITHRKECSVCKS